MAVILSGLGQDEASETLQLELLSTRKRVLGDFARRYDKQHRATGNLLRKRMQIRQSHAVLCQSRRGELNRLRTRCFRRVEFLP